MLDGLDDLSDEDATPLACRDCEGHYRIESWNNGRYSLQLCKFCTRGCMSPTQFAAWRAARDPDSGVRVKLGVTIATVKKAHGNGS